MPAQYCWVNAPSVSACHNFSGVVAMYVTYANTGLSITLLQAFLQVAQRPQPMALVFPDPAFRDLVDRHGVEIVQLLAPTFDRGDKVRVLQDCEMLAHRLPGHGKPSAEF